MTRTSRANGSTIPRPGFRGRRKVGSLYPTFSPPRFQLRMQKETAGRGKCNDRSFQPIWNALSSLRKRSAVVKQFCAASGNCRSTTAVELASLKIEGCRQKEFEAKKPRVSLVKLCRKEECSRVDDLSFTAFTWHFCRNAIEDLMRAVSSRRVSGCRHQGFFAKWVWCACE